MKTKPFHEAIVDALRNCQGPSGEVKDRLKVLGGLIIATEINEGHILIKKIFQKIAKPLGNEVVGSLLFQVTRKLDQEKSLLRPKKPRTN